MKQRKNWLAPLLLGLLLTLAACGGSGNAAEWQEQYDLGVRYLSEGNYGEAILAFTAAIEIDPSRAEAYVGRGGAYIASGETEENLAAALADYEAALERDETLAEAWLGLADVYIRQGDYDRAMEVLREGLEKADDNSKIADKLAEIESGTFSDSSGNTRRMEYYSSDGELLWWHDYSYNDLGHLIKTTVFDAMGNQIDQWDDYEYDDQGNRLISPGYSYDTGEFILINKFVYEGDVLAATYLYGLDGNGGGSLQYEYDSSGNRTKTISCDIDGSPMYYWIHTYNDKGQEVRIDYYNMDGTTYGYNETVYDEEGNRIGTYRYDANGELEGYTQN